jgi:hypothetical protein
MYSTKEAYRAVRMKATNKPILCQNSRSGRIQAKMAKAI